MDFNFIKRNRTSLFERFQDLDLSAVATFLDGWKDEQDGTLILKKRNKRKSPKQLGYYFGKILPMAFENFKSTGDVTIELHLGPEKVVKLPLTLQSVDFFFKIQYAAYNNGVYMDKATMDMAECSRFETYVIGWLAEWRNTHVPPADENWRDNDWRDND